MTSPRPQKAGARPARRRTRGAGRAALARRLESASVAIERSAVEIGKRIVIKAPKTGAGVRSVALPVWLVPGLVHHLDTFAESGPDGRVFLGVYGGDAVPT